ncbi:MAG: hypothetical protein AAGD12_04230 [Pseudomonadota bacterium]
MSTQKDAASMFPTGDTDRSKTLQYTVTYQMLRGALYGFIAITAVVIFIYFWQAVALILPVNAVDDEASLDAILRSVELAAAQLLPGGLAGSGA